MVVLEGKVLWRWKNTNIDFSLYNDGWCDTPHKESKRYMLCRIFRELHLPFDKEIHEWENGQYSSEYNEALRFAFKLDLIEKIYYIKEFESYVDEETYNCWKSYFEECVEPLTKIKEFREKTDV